MIAALAWMACARPPPDDALIVSVRAFGSTEELERQVAEPVEAALSTLPRTNGLRTTVEGDLVVTEVSLDGPAGSALVDLREALDAVLRDLPAGAEIEVEVRGGDEAALYLQLSGGTPEDRAAAWERLRPTLERLPGVRGVEACGSGAPRLVVRVDPQAAAARGVSLAEVEAAVTGGRSPEALAAAGVRDGVSLRDVATVERGTAPAECAAFAGSESVWLVELRAVGSVDLAPAFAALDGPVQVARLADATVVQFRRAPDAEGVGAAVAAAIPRAVVSDRRSGVGRAIGGRAAAIVEVPGVTGAWNPATARIVRVIGPDLAELDRLRDALRARIPAAYDAEAPPRPSVEVTVDPERAEALGLAPDVVARGLAAAWEGLPVAGLPLGGAVADGAIPVVIRVGADGAPLGDATFPGPAGAVPVAAAATLVRGTDRSILRVDRQRAVELAVTGDADLAGAVAEVPLAPGYRIVIVPPDR